MKVIIPPGRSGNVLATIAIGEPVFSAWEQYALPTWEPYCRRYDLGLIAFDDHLLPTDDPAWKKPTWQKLLIGETLQREKLPVRNVCFLDTDILINYTAPNVFEHYGEETVGLVSMRKNLPYPHEQVLRKQAFLRHTYYDSAYPLDSALFISVEDLYRAHGLAPQADEACAGFFLFNVENHSSVMREWFGRYTRDVVSLTGGGDQTHFNFEAQRWGKVSWLDYRFQALWVWEMAWKYPFLYDPQFANDSLKQACIEASLFTNFFLHFAGSWYESEMWKDVRVLDEASRRSLFEKFEAYQAMPVTGRPVGPVKPSGR